MPLAKSPQALERRLDLIHNLPLSMRGEAPRATLILMRVRISLLRHRGRRTRAHGGESFIGELGSHSMHCGSETVAQATLTVREANSSKATNVIPPLHEPTLVTIGTRGMLLRGFESVDGTAYVQEWHILFERDTS